MLEHDSTALAEYLRALERRPRTKPDEELFDQGLAFDLETLLDRRGMLKLVGAASLGAGLLLAGCGTSSKSSGGTAASGASAGAGTGTAGLCSHPRGDGGALPG
jgi:hypothetical protein